MSKEDGHRRIIHVDMDAFFASVEQRDDPTLRGRPVAVGGSGPRSVVAAASYEARRYGVRSAMPSSTAARLCPGLIFRPARFDAYRATSAEIFEVFRSHTPLVERLGLDEAYLDVTESLRGIPTGTETARVIKAEIRERTGLNASAGVSYCKFLAKLASDARKPDGLFVIPPGRGEEFLAPLDVGRFHGIGPAMKEKLNRMGIFTGADLRAQPAERLKEAFGKAGEWFHSVSHGIDARPVRTERETKSTGAENTFARDIFRRDELEAELEPLTYKVWKHLRRGGLSGRTVTLKAKYEDFRQVTRSRTLPSPPVSLEELDAVVKELVPAVLSDEKGIRLAGVSVSGFGHEEEAGDRPQMALPL